MAVEGTRKYAVDGVRGENYVRAWKEGKGRDAEIMVQVWLKKAAPDGEPNGDWAMPGVLGVECAISQSVIQSK